MEQALFELKGCKILRKNGLNLNNEFGIICQKKIRTKKNI